MLNLLTIIQLKQKNGGADRTASANLSFHRFFSNTPAHVTSGPDVGQRSGSPTPPRFHSLEFSPPKFLPFPRVPRQGIPGTPQMRGSPMGWVGKGRWGRDVHTCARFWFRWPAQQLVSNEHKRVSCREAIMRLRPYVT